MLTRRGLLAATAGTLLLGGCGRSGAADGSGATPAPTGADLVVGASLELTGAGPALGVLQERALALTLESLNTEGVRTGRLTRRIRLEVRDNHSDPRLAARQATELATVDGVHALVGGTRTETSMAIVPVAQQQRVPFVSLGFGDGIVLPLPARTFVFKLTPDAADMARRLARQIAAQGLRRVVLLAARGLHGDTGVRAVTAALAVADLELTRTVRLPATGEEFRRAAERVAAADADAVLLWATAPDTAAGARALRRAGYDGPLFLDAGAVAEETLEGDNAAAVEGAYAVHPMSLGGSTLTNTTTTALDRRAFTFRYLQRYGGFSGFAPYGSDALQLIANAAELSGSVDRGRLRAFLQNQITEGLAGSYSFASLRHGGMDGESLGIYTVSQGSWTRVS
ncbi:ABC transporter substrate-binding protein [Micromonospora sp. GCM10011542]|uniref:ABC transporter substrate-binding protein n=1 Tax=Micromonospora sp. GCM10011542 TaxID=3317337 RepID=UPI003621044A